MKKHIILFVLLLLSFDMINSQEKKGFINQEPDFLKVTSPNVATFNKYIDNPVNLYSGIPEVAIPLFTLKDGQIELPVVLNYNTTGIKVAEESGWVGLGWNLNMGGVITQSIVGGDDFQDTQYKDLINLVNINDDNFLSAPYLSIRYNKAMYEKCRDYLTNGTAFNYAGKLNPDVFNFSYPGKSGKFIIDYRNDSIYILNRDDNTKIEITQKVGNEITQFAITTIEGVVHIFNEIVDIHNENPYSRITKSYSLNNSTYPNGQTISYNYQTFPVVQLSRSESLQSVAEGQVFQGGEGGPNSYYQYSENVYYGKEFYLTEVITTNYQILFSVTDRDDYINGKKLDMIKVVNRNQSEVYAKEFKFQYDYFVANSNLPDWWIPPTVEGYSWETDYNIKRLKLTSVLEMNLSGDIKDRYELFYDESMSLPKKTSYEVDYWGYYNGKSGQNTYMPDLRYLLWPVTVETGGNEVLSNSYDDWSNPQYRNRESDYNYCKAGILRGIKYPTGGYTEYIYEPNSYIGHPVPATGPVYFNPNKVVVSVTDCNALNTSSSVDTIKTKKPIKAKIAITLNKGLKNWTDIWYPNMSDTDKPKAYIWRNTEMGFDKIVKTYDSFADQCIYYANHFPNESSIVIEDSFILDTPDTTHTYEYFFQVSYPDSIQGFGDSRSGCMTGVLEYIDPDKSGGIEKTDVQGCGLRIKTINSYDKQGDIIPVLTSEYEYVNPETGKSSGILHEILNFTKYYKGVNYGPIEDPRLYSINYVVVTGNNAASNPYSTVGGVGYSHVKEIRKSANLSNGYKSYIFHNKEPVYSDFSVRIDDPMNGKLLSVRNYDNNKLSIQQDTLKYSVIRKHALRGINVMNAINMFPNLFAGGGFSLGQYNEIYTESTVYPSSYAGYTIYGLLPMLAHRLNTYDITLANKETIIDNVLSKETYMYNPLTLQLKESSIEGEDSLKHIYTYPNDYNCGIYAQMTTKNRLANVIEEKIFRNGGYIGGTVTEYNWNKNNTAIVPANRYFSELTSKLTNPETFSCAGVNNTIYPTANIQYKEYDLFGNSTYIIQNDATRIVYLWSYNGQYPIAEIKNATYDQVKTALGYSDNQINELSVNSVPNVEIIGNQLRSNLSNALVTTYTYKPLVGMTSSTDPRGITTYYEYDGFGRLKCTKDKDGQIIQNFSYHYKP